MKLELNTNGAWRTVIRGLSRHDEEADDQYLDALTREVLTTAFSTSKDPSK